MTADVVMFSGLLGGALAFVSSIIATILLFITNRRQAGLLRELQSQRLSFDEKLADDRRSFEVKLIELRNEYEDRVRESKKEADRQLEEHKDSLNRRRLAFEAELKRHEDFVGRQLANLFAAAERSQMATRESFACFSIMLKNARTSSNDDFLTDFSNSVMAFNTFSATIGSLENLVRRKDKAHLARCRARLLEVLLGMRLELSKRELPDFAERIAEFRAMLDTTSRVLNAKYRRLLQPRVVA